MYTLSEDHPVEEARKNEGQEGAAAGSHQSHESGEVWNGQHNQTRNDDQARPQHTLHTCKVSRVDQV